MAANLGFVTHPAQGHAHELAVGGLGDGLPQGGLAHAGRPHQAKNGRLELVHPLLHGQVLDDAFLDLFQAIVVGVEYLLGVVQALADLGFLPPGQIDQGLDVGAHHGGFRRHGRHHLQFLELRLGLLDGLLGHVGGLDALVQFVQILAFVHVAQFLLDGLDLFVQIVLALALLHLPLDPAADALFHLQDVDLGFHETHQVIEAGLQVGHLQDGLFLVQLEGQVGGDGVGQATGIVDTDQGGQDFRRDLLVEFDVVVELGQQGAAHGLDLGVIRAGFRQGLAPGDEVAALVDEFLNLDPLIALHQHFHRAVGQLQHLQDAGDGAHLVQILETGIVLGCGLLGHQQDVLARLHRRFQGLDGLGPAHEQGDDHVGEDHHVAQGKQRQGDGFGELCGLAHDGLRRASANAV